MGKVFSETSEGVNELLRGIEGDGGYVENESSTSYKQMVYPSNWHNWNNNRNNNNNNNNKRKWKKLTEEEKENRIKADLVKYEKYVSIHLSQ